MTISSCVTTGWSVSKKGAPPFISEAAYAIVLESEDDRLLLDEEGEAFEIG